MSASAPLAGRVVLLLRPAGRAAELSGRLASLGARVLHVPVIRFAPPLDEGPARAALADLARYELVVFASAAGVRAFVDRCAVGPPRAAAVGPATAQALRAAGIEPLLVAAAGRMDGLRAQLAALQPPPRAVLVVRPEGGGSGSFDALRAAGVRVDEVAFYRTVASGAAPRAARLLESGSVDAVVFTSPSTLRVLLAAQSAAALRSVRRVAIGATTAAALAAAGFEAHAVAQAPTPEAVSAALLRALRPDGPVC